MLTIRRTGSATDFSLLIPIAGFLMLGVMGWYSRVAFFFFFSIFIFLLFGCMYIIVNVLDAVWPHGFYKTSLISAIILVPVVLAAVCGLYIGLTNWSGPTANVRAYFSGYTYSAEPAPGAALTRALALPANRPLRRIAKIAVGRHYLRLWLRGGRKVTFGRQAAHHPNGWCCTVGHWYTYNAARGQYKAPLRFLARCTRVAGCSVHVAPGALHHPFTAADVTAMVAAMRTGLAWIPKIPLAKTHQQRQQRAHKHQRRADLATWRDVAPGRAPIKRRVASLS